MSEVAGRIKKFIDLGPRIGCALGGRMRASAVGLTIIILASVGVAATAHAQPTAPVNIPLTYWQGAEKLAINVGINGGAARPYIFDTGSPVFNAAFYNQSFRVAEHAAQSQRQ